jgi:hypothetical protein
MPLQAAAKPTQKGWWNDQINARLVAVYNGTEIFDFDGNDLQVTQALTSSAAIVSSLTGNAFVAATGNVALGNPGAFGTTQPQGAVIMAGTSLSGIAPVGAIATSGAIFASDTVVRKIIAAGTASNIDA